MRRHGAIIEAVCQSPDVRAETAKPPGELCLRPLSYLSDRAQSQRLELTSGLLTDPPQPTHWQIVQEDLDIGLMQDQKPILFAQVRG